MANQKTYSIVINGIKTSISDLDILIDRIDKLEQKLGELGKKGIKIDTKDLEKIKIPEINLDKIGAKALQKEMKDLEKDIAKGAKTIEGEYTNTLAGLRAQLRDMKSDLSKLDLDLDAEEIDDMTQEIAELNERVKEMEQNYGTFSRNVGNYTNSMVDALNEFDGQMYETVDGIKEIKQGVDSLKGMQMINVDIGGQIVQFENLSQAIGEIDDMAQRAAAQLLALKEAGEENSEEYANVNKQFQEFVSKAAELEKARKYSDELKDSMTSMSRGLDMGVQSFQALGNVMQMASGIAGLFGQNQEKVEEAINRTVQIQAILQSAQELYNQTVQKGTVLNKIWNASIAASTTVMKALGIATNTTSKAMKVLKVAIASTGIGLLVIAAGELLSLLGDLWDKFTDFGKAARDAANDLKNFNDELNDTKNEMTKIEDLKFDLGLQDAETTTKNKLALITKQFDLLEKKLIASGVKLSGNWKKVFEIDTSNLSIASVEGVKLLETLVDEYQDAKNVVSEYSETKDKEKNEEYLAAQSKIVAYEQLYNLINGYKDLNKELKEYNKEVEKSKKPEILDNEETLKNYVKEWDEANRTIEKNRIESMKDGFSKRIAELINQREDEINAIASDAVKREEIIASINAKYDAKEVELVKEHGKEMSDLEHEIQSNRIASMKDGLQKRLAELKLSESKEIRDAEGNERKILSIQQKYNKLKLDEIKSYTEEVGELVKNNNDNIYNYIFETQKKIQELNVTSSEKTLSQTVRNFKTLQSNISQLKSNSFGELEMIPKENLERDSKVLKEYLDKQIEYLKLYALGISEQGTEIREETIKALKVLTTNKLRENELAYNNGNYGDKNSDAAKFIYEQEKEKQEKLLQIIKENNVEKISEAIKYTGQYIGVFYEQAAALQKIENINYQQSIDAESEWLRERIKLLSEAEEKELQNINLSEEEKKEIDDRYNKEAEQSNIEYQKRVETLTTQHLRNLYDIEVDINNKRSDFLNEYHKANLSKYKEYYDELSKMMEETSNAKNYDLGSQDLNLFGDFSQFVYNNNKYKDEYNNLLKDILSKRKDLNEQLKDGVISQEVFNLQMEELKQLEESTQNSLDSITMSWEGYVIKVAELIGAVVNMWSQTFLMLSDMQYNNEMKRIEDLEKTYDEELELLQDKFDEQEELFQKHNENVNSIEGELETARGDRRLFLLDQINSEMMKREQAWAIQQKIAKQQEQLEKKKEQLEKQKEAAEKKRNKANQKVQIAQGLANTALAVTNALAVNPWFVGVALAAVAAAMGAAQVAIIAKQKYADGGVIKGKSHSEGGVPVLGGTAEVEGNEFITNKTTTTKNVDLLYYINSKKKKLDLNDFIEFYVGKPSSSKMVPAFKYAEGGQLPTNTAPQIDVRDVVNYNQQDNRPIYVSVVEIESVQDRVRNVRAISGIE